MGLGTSFYVKLVAAIIGIGLAAFLGFVLLDRLVYRYGFIAAMVVVAGILLADRLCHRSKAGAARPGTRLRVEERGPGRTIRSALPLRVFRG